MSDANSKWEIFAVLVYIAFGKFFKQFLHQKDSCIRNGRERQGAGVCVCAILTMADLDGMLVPMMTITTTTT